MSKKRVRRGDSPLPEATVIIRADLLDPDIIEESAVRNFDVYGFYGVSVFAEAAEASWMDIASSRLARFQWIVLFTAGDLEAAGLQLWDTGLHPHYDLVHADPWELVGRMLATTHRVLINPYRNSGGNDDAEHWSSGRPQLRGRRGPLVDAAA